MTEQASNALALAARNPARWATDVDVRPRGCAGNRAPERDKWNPHSAQLLNERFTFHAVGVNGNIHRVVVIETQPIVSLGLSQSRHGQLPPKTLGKISLNPRRFLERPFRTPVETSQVGAFTETVYRQWWHALHFFAEYRFGHSDIGFEHGMAHGINLIECSDESLLRFFDFLLRDLSVLMELALCDDFRAQPALVLLVLDQQRAVGLEARAHFRNPIGALCCP